MGTKRCLACAAAFQASPRVVTQNYCHRPECQLERRRLWQREKRSADDDYRDNQLACQRRWREAHPDYWQQYRVDHPDYAQRNREQQRDRNAQRKVTKIANMGPIQAVPPLPSGIYRVSRENGGEVAKMDAWIVEITLLSTV